jgi:hypothetical protein
VKRGGQEGVAKDQREDVAGGGFPCSATPNWRQIDSKIFGGEVFMKSNVFSHFKIPVLDYDIQAERDERGIPVLSLRARGAGLQRLDMTGASQLKQLLEQAGDNANAQVIADLIKKAQGH